MLYGFYRQLKKLLKRKAPILDIVIPSALFHDMIVYPKNHPDRWNLKHESAESPR